MKTFKQMISECAITKAKLAKLKELKEKYENNELDSEDEFLKTVQAETGLEFNNYEEFKEYIFKNKQKTKQVDKSISQKVF